MRQVVLDTETTGLEVREGHRLIEIGCVELIDRKPTGRQLHHYINPGRTIDEGAEAVHGITLEFLADKPDFASVKEDIVEFLQDAELIIHNAAFDVGFLDAEFKRARERRRTQDFCTITDSLALARAKYPGQKNSLDALCKRLGIDNSARTLHGALLDAEILAEVYLALTGGQASLGLDAPEERAATEDRESEMRKVQRPASLRVTEPNEAELSAHEQMLKKLASESGEARHW
ncbi:MAG: DNA polymerase III subunit epsilon [Pseudomonadales bacterium]|jgi:DNA polymerase-3 subunit epsilon